MLSIGIIVGLVISAGAFLLGWFLKKRSFERTVASAQSEAARIVEEAKKESANIKKERLLEAKDELFKRRKEFENEVQSRKSKLQQFEKQLITREENFERRLEGINKKEQQLSQREQEFGDKMRRSEEREVELKRLISEENEQLEKLSGMTRDEAKKILIENMVESAKNEAAPALKEIRDRTKEESRKEATKIIINAIQRTAAEVSVESSVSVINLQSDEVKGRIIGREGRNIRAFEAATGIDVIVDDTPEAVILSGFDPFRREVARLALERLIADGRIHPARIEEIVEKTRLELEEESRKTGEDTMLELGLPGAHAEILKHIGKMKFRTSYGQNLLHHSVEVALLTGFMAGELALDPKLAKRAGLLHDIGKVAEKHMEGPHALIGYELCRRYNEHPIVANAVGSHHEDIPMEHPIAALLQAADAISGARPGARRESVEDYIKRLEKLEALAKSFDGVLNTYAIQAGRELRVIVDTEKLSDAQADQLAHEIANRIQQEMQYPGQIKVTTIREFRSVALAK